jgi:hypothetical protein
MEIKNDNKKTKTPYTQKKPDRVYDEHDVDKEGYKSPYVTDMEEDEPEEKIAVVSDAYITPQGDLVEEVIVFKTEQTEEVDEPFRSPYTTPEGEEVDDEEYKSPYTTPEEEADR